MIRLFKSFIQNETGAVTIDWVVLTASVVAMSAISFYAIRDSSASMEDAAAGAVAEEQANLFD